MTDIQDHAGQLKNQPLTWAAVPSKLHIMSDENSRPTTLAAAQPSALQRNTRLIAMVVALAAGIIHVAGLWYASLDEGLLLDAGRGMILILLSLGLMGTARLSLVLSILLALTGLVTLIANPVSARLVNWLELMLLISAASALTLQLTRS